MRKGVLHMGILDELLAGGQRQKEYSDFVDRYEQGRPSEGYSDQEVLKRYGEVSHAVPSDQYAQAAQEALSKLSPEDAAGSSRGPWRHAAGKRGPGTEGSGPGAYRSAQQTGAAPRHSRRRWAVSAASVRVKSDHRHAVIPDGQGRARGHRGHGGQACHGQVARPKRQRKEGNAELAARGAGPISNGIPPPTATCSEEGKTA